MRIRNLDIPCGHELIGNPYNGYDHGCSYEYSGDVPCDDCVCNGGFWNPETGKPVRGITKIIQKHRNRKRWKTEREKLKNDEAKKMQETRCMQ